ncbi:MAG: hypothetical protein Q8O67_21830 [Deltaproteobacteria bacterium]|nr:hypothetical protein [Deltaproteobacteria bacterium]
MALRITSLLALVWLVGCAGAPVTTSGLRSPADFDAGPPAFAAVAKPQTPAEAGLLIAEAIDLLQKHDNAAAVPRLEALLRCDFLSERGRANLYWLLAEAARGVDDAGRRDALSGYLVAASILPPDLELREKVARARAMLLADKVQAGVGVGASPERAIVVDSLSEADTLVAHLGCGARGQAPYISRRVPSLAREDQEADDDGLAARRLLCTENGDELVLWFRVSPN